MYLEIVLLKNVLLICFGKSCIYYRRKIIKIYIIVVNLVGLFYKLKIFIVFCIMIFYYFNINFILGDEFL